MLYKKITFKIYPPQKKSKIIREDRQCYQKDIHQEIIGPDFIVLSKLYKIVKEPATLMLLKLF